MTTQEWLAFRRGGIGGTDISAIAGLHPYKSALEVFMDKTGMIGQQPDTLPLKLGRKLEPIIQELYEEATGTQLVSPGLIRHPTLGWARGTPDRVVANAPIGVELKTAGIRQAWRWGDGEDDVPIEYLLQCSWYLELTGYPEWHVAVLIAGQDFRTYRLREDKELQGRLLEIGERFLRDHMEKLVPPPLDASEASAAFLRQRYPRHTDVMLPATEEAEQLVTIIQQEGTSESLAETAKEVAKNRLKDLIGEASGIQGQGWKCTWKKTKPGAAIDWEKIAQVCKPPQSLIQQHTVEKESTRRFLLKFERDKT